MHVARRTSQGANDVGKREKGAAQTGNVDLGQSQPQGCAAQDLQSPVISAPIISDNGPQLSGKNQMGLVSPENQALVTVSPALAAGEQNKRPRPPGESNPTTPLKTNSKVQKTAPSNESDNTK